MDGYFGRVGENVGNDAHGRLGVKYVGVADHELLEYVVLYGAGELAERHVLLECGHNVHGEHGQDGAVHRHRHGHALEIDAVEQLLHVLDGVDGDAAHADVAVDARIVRVVAAMRGQIERHTQALLTGAYIVLVELVALLDSAEAGVLDLFPPQIE